MIGVTFLSLNKKVTKEVSPRGRFEQMRPPWKSLRRFAGSTDQNHTIFYRSCPAQQKSEHFCCVQDLG